MAVTLLIPTALRAFTDRKSSVEVSAENVGEAIIALTQEYPAIKKHLYDDTGKLREYVNLFIGDTNIKDRDGLQTPLKDADEVMLVPAIAGGK
ncbi:molybdopterin synthase sulfur carrier subunit [Clostridia bacterium]|nr:molybdopterin synthase sulfur carrier subunit [Clostridia bacterium]